MGAVLLIWLLFYLITGSIGVGLLLTIVICTFIIILYIDDPKVTKSQSPKTDNSALKNAFIYAIFKELNRK